jgi:hypothetical protein
VFGVKPAYFTDDEVAARTDEQLDVLAMLRDRGLSWQEVNHLPRWRRRRRRCGPWWR